MRRRNVLLATTSMGSHQALRWKLDDVFEVVIGDDRARRRGRMFRVHGLRAAFSTSPGMLRLEQRIGTRHGWLRYRRARHGARPGDSGGSSSAHRDASRPSTLCGEYGCWVDMDQSSPAPDLPAD